MSRTYGPCGWCKKALMDDAHWYFNGDDGGFQYPDGMCGPQYKATVPKRFRRMFKELIEDALERQKYEIDVAVMNERMRIGRSGG